MTVLPRGHFPSSVQAEPNGLLLCGLGLLEVSLRHALLYIVLWGFIVHLGYLSGILACMWTPYWTEEVSVHCMAG